MKSISEISAVLREKEKEVNEITAALIRVVIEKLDEIKDEDERIISRNPLVSIVKFSRLSEENWNMSAEYYISERQIKAIKKKLQHVKSLEELERFLADFIENRFIRITTTNKLFLNKVVVSGLKEILKSMKGV